MGNIAVIMPVIDAIGFIVIVAILWALESSYLGWDYSNPETAVLGVAFPQAVRAA